MLKSFLPIIAIATWAADAQDSTLLTANPPAVPEASKPVPSPWKNELVANFNIASSYYSDWAQGGEDNLAWTTKVLGSSERNGPIWNWQSKFHAEFGQVKLGDRGIRKTTDELKTETVLSRKIIDLASPFASAGLQTQFARGFKYPSDTVPPVAVSDFLDPLYLTQSLGVISKPADWIQSRLGAAVHETRADEFRSFTDSVSSWKVEPGAEWVTDVKTTLSGNILLQSNLSLFTNFKGADEITTSWTSTVAYQFTKFVNVNASTELRRDIQQADLWQWRHTVSLGLSYSIL